MGRKLLDKSEKKVSHQIKVDPQVFGLIQSQMKKREHIPKYSVNMAVRELIGETKISKLIVQDSLDKLENVKTLYEEKS